MFGEAKHLPQAEFTSAEEEKKRGPREQGSWGSGQNAGVRAGGRVERSDHRAERQVIMAKQKDEKTNVMRILEQKGIPYTPHTYPHEEGVAVDGVTVARSMGQDPECVFKTLVARGASNALYVFDIPVGDSLDLKKAAKAVGEKSIAMLHQKELLPLTGYVHGGCSPVGMKKQYPTVFHETAEIIDTILVSAGKIGYQVELAPADLIALVGASTADLTV